MSEEILLGQDVELPPGKKPRELLILQYLPLVRSIARMMALTLPHTVEVDELVGYGVIGLINAARRFDPKRGVKFETYANPVVRGAILDGLRQMDSVSQTMRRKARKVSRLVAELAMQLGRTPTDKEIADKLGLSLKGYFELSREIEPAVQIPLDSLMIDDKGSLVVLIDQTEISKPDEVAERKEVRGLLLDAIGRLPRRERRVITLHYYGGMKVTDIAGLMGVSHARVSQIHKKALGHLSTLLDDHKPELAR